MQLIVDPRLKYNYASWYLYGLAQVVGRRNISYDVRPFRALKYETIPDLQRRDVCTEDIYRYRRSSRSV